MSSKAPRVLIIKLSSLGDVLHALPLARGIKAVRPDCFLGWAIDVRFACLLEHNPYIDHVHLVPMRRWNRGWPTVANLREIKALKQELRAQKYDMALDAHGLLKSGFLLRFSNAPRRIAWARRPGRSRDWPMWLFANERVPLNGAQHAVEVVYRLAEHTFGAPIEERRMYLPLSNEERAWARRWYASVGVADDQPVIGVCPGAAWQSKRWPPERYGAVGNALAERFGTRTVVCWGPGEEDLRDRTLAASAGPAVAIPLTTIREMAALMERLRMFLAGDTGSLHIACALGIPVVGVFGPTDPRSQGPYGVPFRLVSALRPGEKPKQFRNQHSSLIERVQVAQVIEAAQDLGEEIGLGRC